MIDRQENQSGWEYSPVGTNGERRGGMCLRPPRLDRPERVNTESPAGSGRSAGEAMMWALKSPVHGRSRVSPQVPMVGKGVKRKHHADWEQDSFQNLADCPQSYSLKRQLVLNTSLNKMQSGRALPEFSLRRTVLIANTLRQIQEEIRLESSQLAPAVTSDTGGAELGVPREPAPSRLTTESYPAGDGESPEDCMLISSDEDFSLSSAINSILRDLDIVDGSPPLSPPPDTVEAMDLGGEGEVGTSLSEPPRPSESVFGSFEIMSSRYLVGVTLDDLFLDIDTSVCDYEAPGSAPASRVVPSSPAEDSGKSFPLCSSSSLGASSTLRTDLNDLDHIMEILVSS